MAGFSSTHYIGGLKIMICLTIEQWNKVKRLSDFADFYIDDMEPSNSAYESDKEDITQAQEVIQVIDAAQYDRIMRIRANDEAA